MKSTAPYIESLRTTGYGSAKYGNCCFCGKYASEIYISRLVETTEFDDGEILVISKGTPVGHRECIIERYQWPDERHGSLFFFEEQP